MNLNLCPDAIPNFIGFFDTSIAPALLFYAYIPIFLFSIFFGYFIFTKNKNSVLNRYFLGITFSFAFWIFLVLFQWIGAYLETVHLAWELLILPEILIFIFSVLFTYDLVFKKDISALYKYFLAIVLITVAIILPTTLNISSFDLVNCEGVVGAVWPLIYVFELLNIVAIVLIAIERLATNTERTEKLKTVLFSLGMVFFLTIFWLSNYFGELTKTYEINLVGPIGMIIFLGLLSYLIVKFQAFNVKLIATQVLVWVLAILIGSQFFFIKVFINFVLTAVTFVATIVFGNFLIKSVKREIEQKEQLAKLNIELKDLIEQRESLVHLVTHKVKGSFTRSKYIFAGILDGTFGDISPDIKKYAQQGLESDNMGISTVDLVLNADNLSRGVIKYDMKPIDFKKIIQTIIEEKKIPAEAKGLKMTAEIKEGNYNVLGDGNWLKEAMNNLVENSIRYTKQGEINITLEDGDGKIKFNIKDTGVGINDEDKKNLFAQGGRGKNSVKVNVDSTGYGLYSVKLIIEAHKGKVWAKSEGDNKGSTFFVELPTIS